MDFFKPLFTIINVFATSISVVVSSHFTPVITPSPTIEPLAQQEVFHISGSFTKYNQTVTFAADIPKEGGPFVGAVSGACPGDIKGAFTPTPPPAAGTITAHIQATCKSGFLTIPVTANVKGTVDYLTKKGNLHIEAKAAGKSISEDVTPSFEATQ